MSIVIFANSTVFDATPASFTLNITGFFSTRFALMLKGTFGGSIVTIQGGDGSIFEDLKITDNSDGQTHIIHNFAAPGIYNFYAVCSHLKFNLAGGASPNVDVAVLCESRP